MTEFEKQYGCPRCGSQDVRRGSGSSSGRGLFITDSRGQPEFLGYEDANSESILWDTFDLVGSGYFVCCECRHQFDQPKELG